uniref:hypothetical protein n=1 Tax=uncultured Sphingomonas sp. TaxID=158754 RepID=UPI0025F5B618|nr:hypothetical protein [uncultured Sphingomonas sp.]
MRLPFLFLVSALLLTACREQEAPAANQSSVPAAAASGLRTYAGQGRDRLCLDERANRAGLITYGQGDANCSLTGTLQLAGERLTIAPDGDESCRVAATLAGGQVTLGPRMPECAYYCGPTADYSGRSFQMGGGGGPITDLGGDPLC